MDVLMVTQPGDGHLNPLVPVARALEAAGHEVEVATSPSFVDDVERVGLTGVGLGPPFRWDSAIELWPDGANISPEETGYFWIRRFHRDIAVPFVTELCELVRAQRPDLLIAELAVGLCAQAVHELEDVPFVVSSWADEPGHGRISMEESIRESGINAVRGELGLAPMVAADPALWITFTPPRWGELDGSPLAETRRYRLPTDPSGLPVPGASGQPFVYATLGTVFNTARRLLKAFIAAIDDGGWSGLVTVGRNNDPARFDRPARVAVEQYVPQADVLALADVMVCHGGLGSVLGAMGAGCPMVIVPLGADQLDNAEKARRLGIARVVDPADATSETLRATIGEVLESSTQRQACDRLQQETADMPPLSELAGELQRLMP